MTNRHEASFYFANFENDYNPNQLNMVSKALKVLMDADDIHGFGIYTKKNPSNEIDEFVIVLKTTHSPGADWMMMRYVKQTNSKYHRIGKDKKSGIGPDVLYRGLMGDPLNYVIGLTNPAYQIPKANLSIIIRDDSVVEPYWQGVNIECEIGDFKKYGGSRKISRKKYIRKNKKRSYKK